MPVKMLETQKGSPTGASCMRYLAGRTYLDSDLGDDLKRVFLREGWALEIKDQGPSPENKAIKSADENKRRRGRPKGSRNKKTGSK